MTDNTALTRITELVERRTRIESRMKSESQLTVKLSLKRELRFLNRECQRLVSDLLSRFAKIEIQSAVAEGVKRASA